MSADKTIAERQVEIDSLRAQIQLGMDELEKSMRDDGKSDDEIAEVLKPLREQMGTLG